MRWKWRGKMIPDANALYRVYVYCLSELDKENSQSHGTGGIYAERDESGKPLIRLNYRLEREYREKPEITL